jgi:hypothetical protein
VRKDMPVLKGLKNTGKRPRTTRVPHMSMVYCPARWQEKQQRKTRIHQWWHRAQWKKTLWVYAGDSCSSVTVEEGKGKDEWKNSALTATLSGLLLSFYKEQHYYHRLCLSGGSFSKNEFGCPTVTGARSQINCRIYDTTNSPQKALFSCLGSLSHPAP